MAVQTLAPPLKAGAEFVRLSPDRTRMAFVAGEGLWVGAADGSDTRRVTGLDAPVEDLAWSPSGGHLAYVLGSELPTGLARTIGVAEATGGEIARLVGAAFCWGAKRPALLVADLGRQQIVHHALDSEGELAVAELADDGDIRFPPRLVLDPSGQRIAVVSRQRHRGLSELWTVTRTPDGYDRELVTQFPGNAVHVEPIWSAGGKSLAMHVVHHILGKSALIVLAHIRGDGEVVFTHEAIDPPLRPAWSPDGSRVACFVAERGLMLFDARGGDGEAVDASVPAGDLRFDDDCTLVVDGGAAAAVIRL